MYGVLVVDDEIDVVSGIVAYLKGAGDLDLEIHTAYSALEALEKLDQLAIDVIVSDIVMPGMSGLELLDSVRALWPHSRVILLTAHEEFDFIYAATRHEHVSYILKAEAFEKIKAAVAGAIRGIESDRAVVEMQEQVREYMETLTPLLQKEYLADLLAGELSTEESRRKRFHDLGIPLDAGREVLLVLGRLSRAGGGGARPDHALLRYTVKRMADRRFPPELAQIFLPCDRYGLLWLIQDGGDRASGASTQTRPSLNAIVRLAAQSTQTACMDSFQIPVSFAVDSQSTTWDLVPLRYGMLKMLLESHIGTGTDLVLIESGCFETVSVLEHARFAQLTRRIEALLENRDLVGVVHALETMSEMGGAGEFDYWLLEEFQMISLVYLACINRFGMAEKIADRIDMRKLVRIEEHVNWKDAIRFFMALTRLLLAEDSDPSRERAMSAIAKVKLHINEHPEEDLSLTRLGEMVYFNPSYLSRLFKQSTGTNLLTYVCQVRLDRARELLRTTDRRVNEIAACVGFESASYFTQFFKRHTGISPKEYREKG